MMRKGFIIFYYVFFGIGQSQLRGEISGWKIYGDSSTEYWTTQNFYVMSGNYAAELKPKGPITSSNQTQYKYLYQIINTDTNYQYSFSGYILLNNKRYKSALLKIRWYPEKDGNGSYICDHDTAAIITSNIPFIYCCTNHITPPNKALSCKVELYFQYYKWPPFASIYFDHIKFICSSNTNLNLLTNGDFEVQTPVSNINDSSESNKISAQQGHLDIDRKIFSPWNNEQVGIHFILPDKEYNVILCVYDVQGNIMRELFQSNGLSEIYPWSDGSVQWNGRNDQGYFVKQGVYIIYLEAIHNMKGDIIRMKNVVVVAR